MTDFFISPTGSGNLSGSDAGNASVLGNLNTLLTNANGGDRIVLIADKGAYSVTSSINITAGASGSDGAPISIVGLSSTGEPLAASFVGTRAEVYSPTAVQGTEVFRLLAGVSDLTFENLDFQNVANAFRFAGNVSDVTIEHATASNVSRFIENLITGSATEATVSNLVVRDVDVSGFSKGVIRLQYDSHDILIEDVNGDSLLTDGSDFATGIALDGTSHDVVIRDTTMGNIIDTVGGTYWNGDGFATEAGVYNVLFENTRSYNNTDAGYDIKSSTTTLVNAESEGNTRNFRFWNDDTVAIGITGTNPTYHGGASKNPSNVWVMANGHVDISNSTFVDDNGKGFLFDLSEPSSSITIDNVVSNQTGSGNVNQPKAIYQHSSSWVWGTVQIDSQATADTKPGAQSVDVAKMLTIAADAAISPVFTTWTGSALADFLDGASTRDALWGMAGNDTIRGLGGDDSINGGSGLDKLYGGDGNDLLTGEGHLDELYGDAGSDIIIGDFAEVTAKRGAANDKLYGGAGNDILYGDGISLTGTQGGKDYIWGGAGNDVIFGDAGAIGVGGSGGDDTLYGEDGDDTIYGDGAAYATDATGGNDRITGGAGNDVLYGGKGSDTFVYDTAGFGNDLIQDFTRTAGNRDLIDVAALKVRFADLAISYVSGNATIGFPGGGTIVLKGVADLTADDFSGLLPANANAPVAPTMGGTAGDDTLAGGAGADVIGGGAGNDVIDGGSNTDTLHGNDGNDTILGGAHLDLIYGDAGNDTLIGDYAEATVKFAPANDKLYGGEGNDIVYGDAVRMVNAQGGKDYLYGEDGNDTLFGDGEYMFGTSRGGDDVISGGTGNDTIYGDSHFADALSIGGNDRITGGAGNDQIWGGGGDDVFIFEGIGFGKDVIGDFSRVIGNRDLIDLSKLKTDFDHLSISQIHGDTVIGFDGGDSITLTGITSVTAADFVF